MQNLQGKCTQKSMALESLAAATLDDLRVKEFTLQVAVPCAAEMPPAVPDLSGLPVCLY